MRAYSTQRKPEFLYEYMNQKLVEVKDWLSLSDDTISHESGSVRRKI